MLHLFDSFKELLLILISIELVRRQLIIKRLFLPEDIVGYEAFRAWWRVVKEILSRVIDSFRFFKSRLIGLCMSINNIELIFKIRRGVILVFLIILFFNTELWYSLSPIGRIIFLFNLFDPYISLWQLNTFLHIRIIIGTFTIS